jgi:hypothetical protein
MMAQDTKGPEIPKITSDDLVVILQYQKQISDLQNRYHQLYEQFLQSNEVANINAQGSQVGGEMTQAIEKALDDAKIDKTKWTIDRNTGKVVPIAKEQQGK